MPCPVLTVTSSSDPRLAEFLQNLAGRGKPGEKAGQSIESEVLNILGQVRERGDDALLEYGRKFDSPNLKAPLAVPEMELELAAASIPAEDLDIFREAAANIREFHQAQKEKSWFMTRPDGSIFGQKVEAVERAGLYVPGGRGGNTPLISSLLMGVIPAQVAGVREIAIVSPPREDGTINPYILALAYLLEIIEVYRTGGPWSIGALAYGTKSIRPVDVIAGPGNLYVATAKKLVQGRVGIDMLAGPSEILVLADDSAIAGWVAADMLSQAEHDALASAICVTDSASLADMLKQSLTQQLVDLPRSAEATASLKDWGAIIVTPNMALAMEINNMIAPEHLEIAVRDPWLLLPLVRHAGAIFLGHFCPEAIGDYFAGPNHVLPTMGTARFSSALSVQTFCKKSSVISASPACIRSSAPGVASLARLEGLEAHARSVEARTRR